MKAVAYYRVSTAEQGRSGLGLEAQRAAVQRLESAYDLEIVEEFTEVQSGRDNSRPVLAQAIHRARIIGGRLAVAEQSRLARDAHHVFQLRKEGVDWIEADNPNGDRVTVGMKAVFNQEERELISKRTRAALAAAKARGVKLGNPNGAAAFRRAGKGNVAAVAAVRSKTDRFALDRAEVVRDVQDAGARTLREIAAGLNERHVAPPRGTEWHPSGVRRLLKRIEELRPA